MDFDDLQQDEYKKDHMEPHVVHLNNTTIQRHHAATLSQLKATKREKKVVTCVTRAIRVDYNVK